MIEWELTTFCNYNCSYCSLPNLKTEKNEHKLEHFINTTLIPYRDQELFCFGGEPFLHPKIHFIVDKLIIAKQKFVFQTNLSNKSTEIISNLTKNVKIQVSVHSTQTSLEDIIQNIQIVDACNNLVRIDVMYTGMDSIKYYLKIKKIYNGKLYLLPVTGFYETESCKLTKEFNEKRNSPLNKFINFETEKIGDKYRSEIWEEYCDGTLTTYNEPCKYLNDYILYSSDLSIYNCCYRKISTGICKEQKCFLM